MDYTIKDIKSLIQGITRLKVNESDNTVVNDNDIKSGKYCNYYKGNENIKTMVGSLYFDENGDLTVVYPKLYSLSIDVDTTDLSPCGEKKHVSTVGTFKILSKNINGNISVIKEIKTEVNGVLNLDNDNFSILDNKTVQCKLNESDETLSSVLTSSYMYRTEKKTCSVTLSQKTNSLSNWTYVDSTTDYLKIGCSTPIISKLGGTSEIKVIRYYTKHYKKTDMCGNLISTSSVTNNTSDVSALCHINSTNPSVFSRTNNFITAIPQPTDGKERFCIVTAYYENEEASTTIKQEEGYKSQYGYSLLFAKNDTNYLVKTLHNSLEDEFMIELKSEKQLIVNNEIISTIPYYDLDVISYEEWCNAYIINDNDTPYLKVNVTEPNPNKELDRECEIEITNSNNNHKLLLKVKQPKNKLINTSYSLQISGDDMFTTKTIKDARIVLKPLKTLLYEDNTTEVIETLDNECYIDVKCKSSNDEVLTCGGLKQIDFNGAHVIKPTLGFEKDYNDNTLRFIATINNKETKSALSEKHIYDVTLKGEDIIDYEYIFYLKNTQDLYDEYSWNEYDKSEKTFEVISKKIMLKNGVETFQEDCEFDYKLEDNGYNHFLIKTDHKTYIKVKKSDVNKTNEDIVKEYKLIQKESGNAIFINLTNLKKGNETLKKLSIRVFVHSKKITTNIWTNDNGVLKIYNVTNNNNELYKTIPLTKSWLYPNIDKKKDIIYNGYMNFILGNKYRFETENVEVVGKKCDKCYNIKETYLIENDDEGVDLIIEL